MLVVRRRGRKRERERAGLVDERGRLHLPAGTSERAAGRRRIPPLSNNFIFAFNARGPRWDRATVAWRRPMALLDTR